MHAGAANLADHPATLLYDEDCGLCVATAAWLGRRVAPRDLRLLALAAGPADPTVGAAVAGRDLAAALHVVASDGRVFAGARAVLAALRLVPRWRLLAGAFDHRLGHAVLEPLYRWIAANRQRIGRRLGLPASCPMPTAAERPR
jgi:predicted DCC family thiol-disulfide oxidoreductase YuxK